MGNTQQGRPKASSRLTTDIEIIKRLSKLDTDPEEISEHAKNMNKYQLQSILARRQEHASRRKTIRLNSDDCNRILENELEKYKTSTDEDVKLPL